MGIMNFLRNRAGIILVGAIGFAIVAFLVGDALRVGSPFLRGNQSEVGEVAGKPINIDEFRAKVEQNEAQFKQQMGQSSLNPQMASYVVENTWNQTVSEMLLNNEVKRLGLEVGKVEINDMLTGKNPDPQVVQAFGDPKTGEINRAQLNTFLNNIESQAGNPMREQWGNFLLGLKRSRLFQKYNNLVRNSIYVTSLEAREEYLQRNKLASFNYVNLEYASIPDNKVSLTDDDYQEYYNKNKKRFYNREESRSFDYVVFDASPSKADSVGAKQLITKLTADFKATANDSLFVSVNSDTKTPVTYVRKGQLDPALDSAVFNASVGAVIGPVFSNGAFKVAKVVDVRMSPDSVKASHILINPATVGGLDKAKSIADSLRNLISKGANFAELANKFGSDGTKEKGGDLGTFARGSMIPAFEEAVFNGHTGDLKVVATQYGVHVVRIDKQVGSSKVAKVAVLDKVVASSNQTQQAAYSKASEFLGAVDDSKAFDEYAQKHKLRKLVAENVSPSQSSVSGLDNPRELVRWAFEAKEGDVSEKVFEMENTYVVARLSDIRKKGILPLEKVKKEIEPMVRNQVKARMLSEKIEKALAGASSIQQVASKLGRPVQPVQNVVFANPIIPGVAQENKVVGTVFGLEPRKLSKVIEGEQGVYLVQVNGFTNPAPLTNTFSQKQQMSQTIDQRAQGQVLDVLRDKADIKDYRLKFF
ncbi:peptidylprolyl isomerase [Arcticibacter tournemirensis]|uniref:Periplasmic chaperone PpiD n=2 Tax=Arcticibacter tournemirensis TaxID=699437 RepID=A0A4Q0MEK7_9SPHI|nr:SurA N-terminal domain-containing protein [Arcticibacter tournemirensis]RXF71603.1 peptidylprolyl isomerase [Arcticibacter tournemirensis]